MAATATPDGGVSVVADSTNPSHYRQGSIEPIAVIEDWSLGYCLGCVVKYVCRHQHKGNPLSDLRKARWYLDREIRKLEQDCDREPGMIVVKFGSSS